MDGVSRRFVDALWPEKPDFHAALPSQVAIFERAERTDKQHPIPLIKGSKNVEFQALRAIFRVSSANSTNKGHRDIVKANTKQTIAPASRLKRSHEARYSLSEALERIHLLVGGLRLNPQRVRSNLDLSGGMISGEAIMLELGKTIGRQHAHDVVISSCASRGIPKLIFSRSPGSRSPCHGAFEPERD